MQGLRSSQQWGEKKTQVTGHGTLGFEVHTQFPLGRVAQSV
jgi:hypothetical protein